jgi:mannose/cellobiose epimerase-like protein (N-acyl-D-glucosamine 2-epimerase family)
MVGIGAVETGGFGSADIVDVLRRPMIDHSLPLWSGRGWGQSAGGFVENGEGRADQAAARRARVQGRQIYCFAKAAQMAWYPDGREIAMHGLDYLLATAKSPDGRPGFVHLLDLDGSPIDFARDTYDQAFVLLTLSEVYQLTNDAPVRNEIISLLGFLDDGLRSQHGGFIEGIPTALPRRQNPQMHLFEAMIAAFDATGDAVYQRRASELFGIFVVHLYDQKHQVLGEYFEDDLSKIEPVCVEPGHQAEWVWLLEGFERSPAVQPGNNAQRCLHPLYAIETTQRVASGTRGPWTEVSKSIRDVGGRKRKLQKLGSLKLRRESKAPPTKREKPFFSCTGSICVILSRAAGTISSIATISH